MLITDSEQRFPALHKAIGKMRPPVTWVVSPRGFDVEEEYHPVEAVRVETVKAEVRTRPTVVADAPMAWVLAEKSASAQKRVERLAQLRARRELARERERIIQTVSNLRRAKAELELRQSESALKALEERIRSGGHTGRLGWMEAQASRRMAGRFSVAV